MLPFLNKKKLNTTMMATLKPGGVEMDQPMDSGEENHGMMAAASDLLAAIEAKDPSAVAAALQAAYEICEQPMMDEMNSDG